MGVGDTFTYPLLLITFTLLNTVFAMPCDSITSDNMSTLQVNNLQIVIDGNKLFQRPTHPKRGKSSCLSSHGRAAGRSHQVRRRPLGHAAAILYLELYKQYDVLSIFKRPLSSAPSPLLRPFPILLAKTPSSLAFAERHEGNRYGDCSFPPNSYYVAKHSKPSAHSLRVALDMEKSRRQVGIMFPPLC